MINEITTQTDPSSNKAETWDLILVVASNNATARQVFSRLEMLCEDHLAGRYRIEVVDIMEKPEQGYALDIIATPTLIRRRPKPVRRIIGDLTQTSKVLSGLGLSSSEIGSWEKRK